MNQSLSSFLSAVEEGLAKKSNFSQIFSAIELKVDDLTPYIFSVESGYTRNLVYKSSLCEVLLLCWNGVCRTPIHDHSSSDGWMHVIEGELEERIYCPGDFKKECPQIKPLTVRRVIRGDTSFINNDLGVHRIIHGEGRRSLSIHIYCPQIVSYQIIESELGVKKIYQSKNHSEYGKIL